MSGFGVSFEGILRIFFFVLPVCMEDDDFFLVKVWKKCAVNRQWRAESFEVDFWIFKEFQSLREGLKQYFVRDIWSITAHKMNTVGSKLGGYILLLLIQATFIVVYGIFVRYDDRLLPVYKNSTMLANDAPKIDPLSKYPCEYRRLTWLWNRTQLFFLFSFY